MSVLSRQRGRSTSVAPTACSPSEGKPCRARSRFDAPPVLARDARQGGFTLVELMITLAVAVILIAIAVPSFTSLIASNRLTTVANELTDASNVARLEAIKRNTNTQLCSNLSSSNQSDTLGTQCSTAVNGVLPTGGVMAMNGTAAVSVRGALPGLSLPVQLSGNLQALRYNAQGIASSAGTTTPYTGPVAKICTTQISKNNQLTINMTAGSVLAVVTSSGACP